MAQPPTPPPNPPPPPPDGPPPGEEGAEPVRPVWLDRHLWQIQPVRDILAIFAVVGLFWLGSKLSIVTVPLLLAILFAYLLEPVIQWLMRRSGMERRGAVSAILAALVLLVLVPSALGLTFGVIQGAGFARSMGDNVRLLQLSVDAELEARRLERPADVESLERSDLDPGAEEPADPAAQPPSPPPPSPAEAERTDVAPPGADEEVTSAAQSPPRTPEEARARSDRLERLLASRASARWVKMRDFIVGAGDEGNLVSFLKTVSDWLRAEPGRVAQAAAGVSVSAAQALLAFFIGAFALAFGAFLTAFFFFFVATEWVKVQHFAANLVPERNKERTLELAVKFDRAINAFIRGRLTIAFIQAIIFSVGYFVIGVPAAFILGPAVALLSIVPYLALVGVPISIALLLLENHTGLRGSLLWALLAPTVIYFIGQALDDYVLTPAIQGKSTDMSTPAILFASLAGGALFGVFGLLIAIPIAACLKIVIQEILWPRFREWAEGRSKDFLPISD